GEMCWRIIDGTWVLSWFNAGEGTVDVLVHDGPTANLHTATRHQVLHNAPWGGESETGVSQLYGGYIVPGSTLDDLHLLVSQWNAGTGGPYWTQQLRVRGLAWELRAGGSRRWCAGTVPRPCRRRQGPSRSRRGATPPRARGTPRSRAVPGNGRCRCPGARGGPSRRAGRRGGRRR